ncbi:hypothetical protein BGY98DRAFT_974867 [Russula aff. rugulosa BPL654]|nr:hypothetical protein BGY98DRAFT_974867 [Russula aff. rugulosa BPL654]
MDPVSSNPFSSEAILQQLLLCDELWAKAGGDRIEVGLVQQEKLKRASGNMHRKRLRTAELQKKITMERKTEDRVAAQRDETQKPRARRTSVRPKNLSKLGNQGLRKETLVAPSQGVRLPISPRPITGATLGPTEFKDQAWTWTEGSEHISEGTEDVHDKETGEERWTRLRVLEEGMWKCRECPGQTFFDKSTLRRHCKTVHGREYGRWKCPLYPDKSYSRRSGLDRHMKGKHQGGV